VGELDPDVIYVTLALEGGCWMAHRSDRPGEWEYVEDLHVYLMFASVTWAGSTLIHAEVSRV